MRIKDDFLPVAYAVILLNRKAGYPCVFWGDLYGVNGPERPKTPIHSATIAKLLMLRKMYSYGPQNDYLDERKCIGFTRTGQTAHADGAGIAVVISKSQQPWHKRMNVGRQHAGEHWTEVLGSMPGEVMIDSHGYGVFPINGVNGSGRITVWCSTVAPGRERIDRVETKI